MGETPPDLVQRQFADHVWDLQDRICEALAKVDPGLLIAEDTYERLDFKGHPGGGGRTRALRGEIFEGGGVNVSEVWGALDSAFAEQLGGQADDRLWAAGISLILHPVNPRVPTVHMNFRMITLGEQAWFGGGADLTPYYPHGEDFRHFHGVWRDATESLGTYASWKAWCDEYFVNHHRDGEMRGVGGIFFDRWRDGELEADAMAVMALSEHFVPSYLPLVRSRMEEAWDEDDKAFMLHRRGRYVEFNLLHDRGTTFGLRTGGRTDSILVSLPPRVRFDYRWAPAEGTPHALMNSWYRPIDWVSHDG